MGRPGTEASGASVTVASEPSDDEPGWTEVPERHLLACTAHEVSVRPLASLPAEKPSSPVTTRTDSDVSTEGIFTA